MESRDWSWLSGIMTGLARAAMRVSWLYPWVELVSYTPLQLDRPLIPLWPMVLTLLGSWAITRMTIQTQLAPGEAGYEVDERAALRRSRLFIAVLGIGLLLWLLWWRLYRQAFPIWDGGWVERLVRELTSGRETARPLGVTLAGAYLWLRGVADGRARPWHETIFRAFGVGLAWLVALAVVAHYRPALRPPNLWVAALAFIVSALAALALVDLDEVRRRSGALIRSRLRLDRYWLLTLLVTIGAIAALGLILTCLAAPLRITGLMEAVALLLSFLADLLILIVAYPLLLIAVLLVRAFRWLLQTLPPDWGDRYLDRGFAAELPPIGGEGVRVPVWLHTPARVLSVMLLVGGIGLIFALALRRVARQDSEGVEETRELIWSAEIMRDEWRALLHRLGRRLRPDRKAKASFLSLGGVEPDRRAIRRVYQELLSMLEDWGLPRPPGATPLEYASMAEDRYAAAEWHAIAEAYSQARYAIAPLPPGLADQVQADWARLCRDWQRSESGDGAPVPPNNSGD